MLNIFLTGKSGVGKSSLLFKIINEFNCSIGGYIEKKIINNNEIKYDMVSLVDGRQNNIIGVSYLDNKDYKVFKEVFNTIGVEIIQKSIKNSDVIVMDEIGFFELNCIEFREEIIRALDCSKFVIGVIKKSDNDFLNKIRTRSDVLIFEVNFDNREKLFYDIMNVIKNKKIPLKGEQIFNINRSVAKEYKRDLELKLNNYPLKIIDHISRVVGEFKNVKILDIGCGPGTFTIPLAKKGAKVKAIDSSIYMIDLLLDEAKNERINSIQCSLCPWERTKIEECDIAICAFACNTIKDAEEFKKLYQITKKYIFIIMNSENKEFEFGLESVLNLEGKNIKNIKPYMSFIDILIKGKYAFMVNFIDINFHKSFENINDIYDFISDRLKIQNMNKEILNEIDKKIFKYKNYYILPNKKRCAVITIIKRGDGCEG